MKPIAKKWLRILIAADLLLLLLVVVIGLDARAQLQAPLRISAEQSFEIESGRSLQSVLAELESRDWLPSPRAALYARLYARWQGLAPRIKSGEYAIPASISLLDTLALFVSGKTVLHELRIPEGWTFAQMLGAIRAHPAIEQTAAAASTEALMAAIGRPGVHPEGRFFPDTYRFARHTSDLALLRQAYAAMGKVLAQEWAQRAPGLPYNSADEALIMASIVEKETGAAHERAQIAGVFVRRLQLGMRLQTDPTIIYGLGERFDGNLRKVDLLTDGPYNSYMRGGLPPSPICLPGRAAIAAALHPAAGEALFFVSRNDGTHVFSATLAEHEAAVREFQLKKK